MRINGQTKNAGPARKADNRVEYDFVRIEIIVALIARAQRAENRDVAGRRKRHCARVSGKRKFTSASKTKRNPPGSITSKYEADSNIQFSTIMYANKF